MARGSILIVNDGTAVRAVLDALVRAQGYLVLTAKNGPDALAATEAHAFDAVFVDLARSARDSREWRGPSRPGGCPPNASGDGRTRRGVYHRG